MAQIPGFTLFPPTQFLYSPAHPATNSERADTARHSKGYAPRGLKALLKRDSICSADETTCPQGDWCCGSGQSCTVNSDGSFWCCAAGAGASGCSRVCVSGDFQCGSVCCASGQTCLGGDTAFPACAGSRSSVTSTTATRTATSLSSTTTVSSFTTSASPTTSTTSAAESSSATSLMLAPGTPTASPSGTLATAPTSSTSASADPSASVGEGGMSVGAQIGIGIAVPVVVIVLVVGLWLCLFRRPNRRPPPRSYLEADNVSPLGTPPPRYPPDPKDVILADSYIPKRPPRTAEYEMSSLPPPSPRTLTTPAPGTGIVVTTTTTETCTLDPRHHENQRQLQEQARSLHSSGSGHSGHARHGSGTFFHHPIDADRPLSPGSPYNRRKTPGHSRVASGASAASGAVAAATSGAGAVSSCPAEAAAAEDKTEQERLLLHERQIRLAKEKECLMQLATLDREEKDIQKRLRELQKDDQ
ncbi:hypothetical protein QBC46DRAFT_385456 [Diplogelasinospora grovesii]|uniref:Uncharacterized protein n=1 Tax=Diplogelasinospora grovesii TaxID=303347 RepID=A0AAN6N7B4_9PEZI|nr:hypothetical protein QBC46DRAFT_385456 [Diplogelasinospora grovesii]